MSIVTISRDSYCPSKQVAEEVADMLGFACISGDVLTEASKEFDVPEIKLLHALRDAPSLLERLGFAKETYVAYIQVALLTHLQKDNIVYYGLAGHHLIRNVTHALKVRIIGEKEDRVKILMQHHEWHRQAAMAFAGMSLPGGHLPAPDHLSTAEALRILEESDEARRKWGLHIYGIDTHDPSLYDVVLHLKKLTIDNAAEMICHLARSDRFQTTAESQQALDDLLLAARVRARIIKTYPRAKVWAAAGSVSIALEGATSREQRRVRDMVEGIPEVRHVDIDAFRYVVPD